jgi:hypothetical protein
LREAACLEPTRHQKNESLGGNACAARHRPVESADPRAIPARDLPSGTRHAFDDPRIAEATPT